MSEDAERGQFVTMVTATDPDIVDHSRLVYGITGGNNQQMFDISSKSGKSIKYNKQLLLTTTIIIINNSINLGIITVSNLNKLKTVNEHVLNVSVSDGVYTSFSRVRIEMVSTNRHNPVFEKFQYDGRILENQIAGTEIIRVHAIDNDTGPYGEVSYSIPSKKISKIFNINNMTGMLSVY